MIHDRPHPFAHQSVVLSAQDPILGGCTFVVEDWFDRVSGGSWQAAGTHVAVDYKMRRDLAGLPIDDEVLYGSIDGNARLVHASQLDPVTVTR